MDPKLWPPSNAVPSPPPIQAKLYEMRHDYEQAEKLYRYNLARLDAEAGPQGGGPVSSALMGSDSVEALLFLASRCKVCVVLCCAMLLAWVLLAQVLCCADCTCGVLGSRSPVSLALKESDSVEALLFLTSRCKVCCAACACDMPGSHSPVSPALMGSDMEALLFLASQCKVCVLCCVAMCCMLCCLHM